MSAPGRPASGIPLLLSAAFCYGCNIPFARMAAQLGVPGVDLVVLRGSLLCACVLATAVVLGRSLAVEPGERMTMLGLALACAVIGPAYLSSVAFVPVGIAVMVFYTYPLFILALSPFVDGATLTSARLSVFALAFAGIALAIGPSSGGLDWRGLALALLASIGATAQFFFAARGPGGGGMVALFWVNLTVFPVSLVLSLATGGPAGGLAFTAAAVPVALTTVFFLAGLVLQLRGLRLAGATAAGLVFCLEPVIAIAVAALVLDERLSPVQYAGAGLVLAAIMLNFGFGFRRRQAALP